MKKRIAFFGPLNPIPSGISDYDEELLPFLRQHYDLDVFFTDAIKRQDAYPHGDFLIRNRRQPYDLTLYQIGNSLLHEIMYGYLFQFPGATVFHDYCLHHSRAKMLLMRGLFDEYSEEAVKAHPEEPLVAEMVTRGMGGDLLLYNFPFVRLLAESALAVGAHTDWAIQNLQKFETPAIKIPMAVDVSLDKHTMRTRNTEQLTLASFGFVTPEKRISSVLKVLIDLRHFYPNIRYVIVGEVASHYNLTDEIAKWNLQDIVQITGRTTRDEFHQWMSCADIIINLRYPSAREMSATLLRAMALGKPVLMSRLLHLQEIPDDAVIRIRPNNEQVEIFHNLWQLIESRSLREKIGRKAAGYIQSHHRPDQMLKQYVELIETAMERKSKFKPKNLPLHLSDSSEVIQKYIQKTSFGDQNSNFINEIFKRPSS
jgi:glycosyltransferase involved in cell wall biosynthesis